MRTLFLSLATGASLLCGGLAAQAMPAGAVAGDNASPEVILVSGGCGPAFHRTPFGACRPNGGFYGRPFGFGYGYRRGYAYRGGYYRHY